MPTKRTAIAQSQYSSMMSHNQETDKPGGILRESHLSEPSPGFITPDLDKLRQTRFCQSQMRRQIDSYCINQCRYYKRCRDG